MTPDHTVHPQWPHPVTLGDAHVLVRELKNAGTNRHKYGLDAAAATYLREAAIVEMLIGMVEAKPAADDVARDARVISIELRWNGHSIRKLLSVDVALTSNAPEIELYAADCWDKIRPIMLAGQSAQGGE